MPNSQTMILVKWMMPNSKCHWPLWALLKHCTHLMVCLYTTDYLALIFICFLPFQVKTRAQSKLMKQKSLKLSNLIKVTAGHVSVVLIRPILKKVLSLLHIFNVLYLNQNDVDFLIQYLHIPNAQHNNRQYL